MGLVIRLPLGFIKQKINDFSVRKQEPTARPEDGIHPASYRLKFQAEMKWRFVWSNATSKRSINYD
jgi:hypothetical protein